MKRLLKSLFRIFGLRVTRETIIEIGSDKRPVGDVKSLLEDLKQRGLACTSILDVGANWSGWSRMAREIFPAAHFYLIEPQLEMEEPLKKFCQEVTTANYFLAGAGSKKETLSLTMWDDLQGSSFLPAPNDELKTSGRQREVEMVVIDELIDSGKMKMPNIIKLDIQGFELEALRGAEKTFGHTDVYILEVSLFHFSEVPGIPIFSDVINFMLERGYVLYDFGGFSRRPFDGALAQCDVCFAKKNGFLRKSNEWK
jgi:FkbM family methyltransferase